jgi:hypothetical protein
MVTSVPPIGSSSLDAFSMFHQQQASNHHSAQYVTMHKPQYVIQYVISVCTHVWSTGFNNIEPLIAYDYNVYLKYWHEYFPRAVRPPTADRAALLLLLLHHEHTAPVAAQLT